MWVECTAAFKDVVAPVALGLGVRVILDLVVQQQLLHCVELHPAGVASSYAVLPASGRAP